LVVLEHELSILEFDFCVTARHRNVINPQVRLVTSTEFEDVFLRGWSNNVNNSTSVFLLIETFEHHVVTFLLLVLDQFKLVVHILDHEGVSSFTDLTLECFPEETTKVCGLLRLSLDFEP